MTEYYFSRQHGISIDFGKREIRLYRTGWSIKYMEVRIEDGKPIQEQPNEQNHMMKEFMIEFERLAEGDQDVNIDDLHDALQKQGWYDYQTDGYRNIALYNGMIYERRPGVYALTDKKK